MNGRHDNALKAARRLCDSSDSLLLYLTICGSELYDTSTGQSDLDARGLFLPSLQSIILRENQKSLHCSTGKNDNSLAQELSGRFAYDWRFVKNFLLGCYGFA